MLTVEDCLEKLDELHWEDTDVQISDAWDRDFISNVCEHTRTGKALSTEQAKVALKLVNRYQTQLVQVGAIEATLEVLLKSPVYRHQLYESTVVPREVRWLGNNKLVFRSKYNSHIVNDLKKARGENYFPGGTYPYFDRNTKLWVVDVNSGNLEKVMEIIKRYRFQFDSDVETFFLQAANSLGQPSEFTIEGDDLRVTVRDDDFLGAWLNGIIAMEQGDV